MEPVTTIAFTFFPNLVADFNNSNPLFESRSTFGLSQGE